MGQGHVTIHTRGYRLAKGSWVRVSGKECDRRLDGEGKSWVVTARSALFVRGAFGCGGEFRL